MPSSGWADNYSESIPRLLAALKGPRLGLIGPWAHSYPFDATVAPAIGWLQEAIRWFDHWLKNNDTGIMKEPMYRVWMQDSVPPKTAYRERPGRWVGETQWPSPRIVHEKHYLNFGGHPRLEKNCAKKNQASARPSGLALAPAKWAATARMPNGLSTSAKMMAAHWSSPACRLTEAN